VLRLNGREHGVHQLNTHPNRILNSVPHNVFEALQPHLNSVQLEFGQLVAETERPISNVYFPHSGVISLVVEMNVGDMIETAMVGRDGVVNAASALDGKISLHRGIVQVEGAASVISPDALCDIADAFKPLRSILTATKKLWIRYRRGNVEITDVDGLKAGHVSATSGYLPTMKSCSLRKAPANPSWLSVSFSWRRSWQAWR
jgi:hypothetical protein